MENYTKIRPIGKGSFGQVFLVKSSKDGLSYVLKQIDMSKLNRKEKTTALREVKLLSSLNHPNIVRYVDSFVTPSPEYLCIVMEYCDGGDLQHKIAASKRTSSYYSEEQILDWLIQMSLALEYCHQRKILHRDIKSQNVFMTSEKVLKVGDFGIARTLGGTSDFACTMVGTPYYLSPEIVQERPYNNMSDMWALGVVLYELMSFRPPFDAVDMKGLMNKILRGIYDPLSSRYSAELRAITDRLLVREPSSRLKASQILELPVVRARLVKLVAGTADSNVPASYITQLVNIGALNRENPKMLLPVLDDSKPVKRSPLISNEPPPVRRNSVPCLPVIPPRPPAVPRALSVRQVPVQAPPQFLRMMR